MKTLEEVYGITQDTAAFAVVNDLTNYLYDGCKLLGEKLMPFSISSGVAKHAEATLDLAQFQGLVNSESTIFSEVTSYRRKKYSEIGVFLLIEDSVNKALFIDYLLTISVCYVEVPRDTTIGGENQRKYDKFFATKNPTLMGAWVGEFPSEMKAKYSHKIESSASNFISEETYLVKLNMSPKGTTITCPRTPVSLKNVICVPLFMTNAFTESFTKVIEDNIVEITYLKDNNTERVLNTTISPRIIMEYYNDANLVENTINAVDIFSANVGGILMSRTQSRGYVYVPELGGSRYDASHTRALNISRILKLRKVESVDRSYIDVDLDSVIEAFKLNIADLALNNPAGVRTIYDTFDIHFEGDSTVSPMTLAEAVKERVGQYDTIFTTTFRRKLHTLMVSMPSLFPDYTGMPLANISSSSNYGVSTMDF